MFVFNIYEFRVQFLIFILLQYQLSALNELTIKEGLFHNLAVSVYLPLVTVLSREPFLLLSGVLRGCLKGLWVLLLAYFRYRS